jgi:hypothetical protein
VPAGRGLGASPRPELISSYPAFLLAALRTQAF